MAATTPLPVARDSGVAGGINGTIYYSGGNLTTTTYKGVLAQDSVVPAPPTGLGAVPGDARVALTWNVNTEGDLAGYHIFRSTSTPVPTAGTPLNGSTLVTASSYLDTSVTDGTTYNYVVQAVDASGNRSAASNTVSAAPVEALRPAGSTSRSTSRAKRRPFPWG